MPYPEVNSHANAVRVGAAMPDLPAFQVVKPNEQLKVEDFRLPDGSPMVGPNGYLVPPAREFSMVVNAATRVYSYRFDEAMRDNWVNARAMRRDAFIRGLLEERILPTINRRWQLDVDDDRDPDQVAVRDGLTKVVEAIPDFDVFKRALLDGVWYGRAGCQWNYFRDPEVDDLWGVKKWDPVHGDSIQFTYDGVPAILMDAMTAGWYSANGATQGQWGDIRSTDRGGMALVLQKPTWRDRFAIHQHIREKADYFEGELAGSVQGLGLRGLVYWHYLIRTDALTWMLAYMQSVGQMDMLIFNYPWGNDAARNQQQANANKIIGKAAFIVPRNPQGNWQAVEQLSMNDSGLKALHDLISEYFDRHIERLIVGQSMSAGADNDSGLGGSGRANFAKATKDEILVYDTNRLDEVLTRDLIKPLKKYNFKWARFPVRFKSVLPNLEADKKVAAGKTMVELKIPIKVDELREAAGYSRPEEGDEIVQPPAPPTPPGMPGAPGAPPPGDPTAGTPQPGQPQPAPQMPPSGAPPALPPTPELAQPNQPVNPTSQIPFGGGFGPSFNSRQPTSYVTDATGHEHKGSGPGGGQFTGSGSGDSETGPKQQSRQDTVPAGKRSPLKEKLYRAGGTSEAQGGYQAIGSGVYLTTDPEVAKTYGPEVKEFNPPQGDFLEVAGDKEMDQVRAAAKSWSEQRLKDYLARGGLDGLTIAKMINPPEQVREYLQSQGIVGVKYNHISSDDHHDQVLVFDPISLKDKPTQNSAQRYDATPAASPSVAPYFPGGSNAYLPKFDKTEIGFTRLSKGQEPTQYAEGWVTIGAQGPEGDKHGGTPVYVKDGKIEKGPQGTVGNSPSHPRGSRDATLTQPREETSPLSTVTGRPAQSETPETPSESSHDTPGSPEPPMPEQPPPPPEAAPRVEETPKAPPKVGVEFLRGHGIIPLVQRGVKPDRAAMIVDRVASIVGNMADWEAAALRGGSGQLLHLKIEPGSVVRTHQGSRALAYFSTGFDGRQLVVASSLADRKEVRPTFGQRLVGGNLQSILRHELGHAVQSAVGREARKNGQKPFFEIYKSKPQSYWAKTVSKYGATKPEELFSEAYAAWKHPGYSSSKGLPPELVAYFEAAGVPRGVPDETPVRTDNSRSVYERLPPTQYAKLGCVMVPLQGQAAIELLSRANLVRDCDLADDGREEEPHVTVRYGFHGGVTMGDVEEALAGKGPFELTLGKMSCFYGEDSGKDYDVVKVDVTSPQLRAMNSILGRLPNTATHSEFRPHATIAYVKAGRGREYVKLLAPLDLTVTVDELEYSDASRAKSFFRLHGLRPRSESVRYSTDAHGHEHKESGPGGGQFTSKGGTSGGDNAVPPPTSSSSEHGGSAPSFAEEIKTWDDDKIWHEMQKHSSALMGMDRNRPSYADVEAKLKSIRDEERRRAIERAEQDRLARKNPAVKHVIANGGSGQPNRELPDSSRPKLSSREIKEVQQYLDDDTPYYAVNEHLRSGGRMVDKTLASAIDKAKPFDKPVTVGRGLQVDDLAELIRQLETGSFTDSGFMSTTTGKPFAGNVQFTIHATKGLDASYYGTNSGELLLPAGSSFDVLSVKRDGDKVKAVLRQRVDPKKTTYRERQHLTRYEAVHAPAGGATVAGKRFEGGEFIPSDVMAEATPEERKTIGASETSEVQPRKGKGKAARVKSIEDVARSIEVTDDKTQESTVTRRDYDDIEAEMTSAERKRMKRHLDGLRDEWVDYRLDETEFDTDYAEAAKDAGWSDEDVEKKVLALLDGVDWSEWNDANEVEAAAREIVEDWYKSTSKHGVDVIDELERALRRDSEWDFDNEVADAVAGLRDEAESAIQEKLDEQVESARESYREDLEEKWERQSDDREEYLSEWFDENEDRFEGTTLENGKWGVDSDGDRIFNFETSSGHEYEINAIPYKEVGQGGYEVSFTPKGEGEYKITGAGGAHEVFSTVTSAVTALVLKTSPPALSFTAAEPSRQKLYDRLVRSVVSLAPEYEAVAVMTPNQPRRYFVVERSRMGELHELIARKAVAAQVENLPAKYSNDRTHVEVLTPASPEEVKHWQTEAAWNEADHPRKAGGQFTTKSNEGSGSSATSQTSPAPSNPVSPTTAKVLSRLPRTAYARLASRVTKVTEAPTVEAVTDAWYAGDPGHTGKRVPCYGFYDPVTGELVTGPGGPGVDQRGVVAHEIGHALDQSDDRRHFDLSGDPEFVAAWRDEMGRGQLSRYAATDEVEGFAELCRLLYGTDDGLERAAREFPRSYAYFKRVGLVP